MFTSNKRLNALIVLGWFGLRPSITCSGKVDGGGAQIHAVMSVISFCKYYDYTYLHTPFRSIEHVASPDQVKEWEYLFDLGSGHPSIDEFKLPIIKLREYIISPRLWFKDVVLALHHAHPFADCYVDAYVHVARQTVNKKASRLDNNGLVVGVHVRRGDVNSKDHPDRYTPNEVLVESIKAIQLKCSEFGKSANFTIFSEGSRSDFVEFEAIGCNLDLNSEPTKVLRRLSEVDILFMAKSSFSYVAALYNPNVVIYEKFWHPKRKNWVSFDNVSQLYQKIGEYCSSLN